MTTPPAPPPQDPAAVAKEVMRLNELYVDSTLKLSLAADNRALSISGTLAAATTLLGGYGLNTLLPLVSTPSTNATTTLLQALQTAPSKAAMAGAAISCACMFMFALILAVSTLKPRRVCVPGNLKTCWSDAEIDGPLKDALLSQAEVYDRQAQKNIEMLSSNASRIRYALNTVVAAMPISAMIGLLIFVTAAR